MRKIIAAKLHGLKVTGADLNYHGSITLDPDHCEQAGILPLEFVEIWNKSSGARISTYVILGERGSRCCVLNGAAAASRADVRPWVAGGVYKVRCSAAVTAGAELQLDTSTTGTLVTRTTGPAVAKALETTSGAKRISVFEARPPIRTVCAA